MYSSLVWNSDGGVLETDAAQSWEVAANGLTWTFTLRDNVLFHDGLSPVDPRDGTPMTAADAAYSMRKIMGLEDGVVSARSGWMKEFVDISRPDGGLEVVDSTTLRVHMAKPLAALPEILALGFSAIVPDGTTRTELQVRPYGSGPFKLKTSDPGTLWRYERNQDYFKSGLPYLDEIWHINIQGTEVVESAFITNQIDMMSGNPTVDNESLFQDLVDLGDIVMLPYNTHCSPQGVFMNSAAPPFNGLRVRQAVNLAIDRQDYDTVVHYGNATPGLFLDTGGWGLTEAEILLLPGYRQPKTTDLAAAQALMAEAGYPAGVAVEMIVRDSSTYRRQAEFIAGELQGIDIQVTLIIMNSAQFFPKWESLDYQLLSYYFCQTTNTPAELFTQYFVTGGSRNWVGYSNSTFDTDFFDMVGTLGPVSRKLKAQALEDILMNDLPIAPLPVHNSSKNYWSYVQDVPLGVTRYMDEKLERIWLDETAPPSPTPPPTPTPAPPEPTPAPTAVGPTPTPAPPPTATPTPTPTGPTPTPAISQTTSLTCSTFTWGNPYNINWYRPKSTPLSTTPPPGIVQEPAYVTAQSLYGTLTFQGTSLIAVVEDLPDDTYRLIVDVNQNGDLTDDQLYQANSGYEAVQGLEFLVHYPSSNTDRTYSISLYHWIPFQTLQYYRTHLCAGTLPLEAMDRQIVVLDDDADSVFGEPSVDWVVLDIDGNGVADGVSGGGEQFKQGAAFYVGGNPYSVSSVPPEGDSITVASAALGTWEGDITNESTGQPVLGASVKIFAPGLATTVPADQSGHYQVQLGAGAYQKVFVSAPGFVPEALYWTAPSVAGWGNTTLPYSLKPVPPPVATVSLVDGDSFNFLGVEAGRYTGGDFYATVQDPDFRFYANNMGQQGLQDLGDLGPVPLDTVSIPESGYYRYGVTAVAGHTYVSLALEAEDGHYIVFRVTEVVPGDHVALTYLFTPPWPDAVLPTPTPTPTPIPGLSPPALVLMAALLVAASIWTSRRRLRRERVNSA